MRAKTTNVIELNGKLYDAQTGKPIADKKPKGATAKTTAQKSSKPTAKSTSRSIDGFSVNTGKKTPPASSKPKVQENRKNQIVAAQPNASKATQKRHTKAPSRKHHAQRSTTLNRRAVKTPTVHVSSEVMPRTVPPKEDINKRLARAMQVSKSSVINRFPKTAAAIAHPVEKLPLKKEAVAKKEPQATLVHEKITKAPVKSVEAEPQKTPQNRSSRRIKKRHISSFGTILMSLLALAAIGYLVYLNIPAVSIKVASSQAGFGATLPSYTPEGYRIEGPAQANAGVVNIKYQSTSDGRNFTISEQQSNWDAEALKENYIAKQTDSEPTTQQYNGVTVYLYGNKAAWVNAGVLYALNTNGSQLGVDQILKLATST